MRYGLGIGLPVMLLAGVALSAPETQTFPVTVSNAVSGKLETVPVTFRIGETNGAVERVDGQRFVPVPVRGELAFPYTEQLERGRAQMVFLQRLQSIQLPEIRLPEMTLSNAVEVIADAVHRADTSTNAPIQFIYRGQKYPKTSLVPLIPPTVLPATNALAALRIEAFIERTLSHDNPAPESDDPFANGSGRDRGKYPAVVTYAQAHKNGIVIKPFGGEDWVEDFITRSYHVPAIFFKRFSNTEEFRRYALTQTGLNTNTFNVMFLPEIGKIRVEFFADWKHGLGFDVCDQMEFHFDGQVLYPLFTEWRESPHKTFVPVKRIRDDSLLIWASLGGYFLGFYRYHAETGADGAWSDYLRPCPWTDNWIDDQMLSMPCVLPVTVDRGLFRRHTEADECWVLSSDCGRVFRLEGERFVEVPVEPDPTLLAVRSMGGEHNLANADQVVEWTYVGFPGRFMLEGRKEHIRLELVLTDTYRDIVRRYRSGTGKDGKRWERFEMVK